jgi:Mn-containing catalase
MQYLFQNINFRGDATPYKDLLSNITTEEMGYVDKDYKRSIGWNEHQPI